MQDCLHAWRGLRSMLGVFCNHSPPFFHCFSFIFKVINNYVISPFPFLPPNPPIIFWQGFSLKLELTNLARVTGQHTLGLSVFYPFSAAISKHWLKPTKGRIYFTLQLIVPITLHNWRHLKQRSGRVTASWLAFQTHIVTTLLCPKPTCPQVALLTVAGPSHINH